MNKGTLARKVGLAVIATLTAFAGLAPFITPGASAASNYSQVRYDGADRFDTAALIASAIAEATPTAILARADIFPDALTGTFAAAANEQGPLLLTRSDAVPARTMEALDAEGVEKVILLGGASAINDSVRAQLVAAGYTVERLEGATRYHTAIRIAQDGAPIIGTVEGRRAALISNGLNFPDALAGAPLSFAAGLPSLLTPPNYPGAPSDQGAFNDVVNALNGLDIEHLYVLGGPAAVSQSVEDELRARGFTTSRLAGANRSATSVDIFEFGLAEDIYTNRRFGLARGDAFPDALAYGPLGGRDRSSPAPQSGEPDTGGDANGLLLAASHCTLSTEVANFIEAHNDTWTEGEILGGPAAICETVADQVAAAAETEPVAADADVTLSPNSGASGSEITASYDGDRPGRVTDVSSSNCTITNEQADGNDRTFTITGDADESCTITTTVTFTDAEGGTDTFTDTFTVTAPAVASGTSRPELQSATFRSTNASGTANPQGTTVRYCFDEPVGAATAGGYHLYRADRTQITPTAAGGTNPTAFAVSGTNCVDVLFPQLTSTTGGASQNGIGDVTLATVDLGAATDFDGLTNPEGDAPLGSTAGEQFTAGRTQAPDLVSVSGTGSAPAGNPASSIVAFTFDQAAFIQSAPAAGQFSVVLTDGTVIDCTGPNTTGDNAGGTAGASGNGTTTINVVCGNVPTGGNGTPLTTGTGGNIARGVVESDVVGTTPPSGTTISGQAGAACGAQVSSLTGGSNVGTFNRCNPQESSDTPHANTPTVELLSVTFQPSTSSTTNDVVFFNFDQPISAPGAAAGYAVYEHDGDEIVGNSGAGSGCVDSSGVPANCPVPVAGSGTAQSQVAVFFPAGTVADTTGGNVENGTVTSTTGQTNRDDEAAATNAPTGSAGTVSGRTSAPDLLSVALATTGTFGNQYVATYTFDEAIDEVNEGRLFLYLADGTRLQCTTATEGATSSSTPNNTTITCTAYNVVSGPGAGTGGTIGAGPASNAQVGSATLGTADDGAVVEQGAVITPGVAPNPNTPAQPNTGNPEGAELTTGGTGTRTV